MGSSVFTARETPLTAANLNKHLAGDGLPNTGDVALGGASGLFWDDTNKRLGIGTQAPTQTLVVRDGKVALSNSDTDHGMTVLADTSVCGFLGVGSASSGALFVRGLSDGDYGGLYLEGVIGTDTPSTTTPAVQIQANKKSGTTYQALAATDMAFAVQNSTTRIFAMRGNGHVGINTDTPGSSLELNLATADLEIVDAGTAGATETAWIEIQVGNSTKFIRCFDTK
jgi:hypothetical protein